MISPRASLAWARRHVGVLGVVLAVLLAGGVAGAAAVVSSCGDEDGDHDGYALRAAIPPSRSGFADAAFQTVGARMTGGHHVAHLRNGEVFDALETSIRAARSSVHVVMYIWEKGAASDRIVAALGDRARAGVACRIVIDDFGSSDFDDDLRPALEAAGCEVRTFRPVLEGDDELARNHRKIVVVDGHVAFVGGFGIRDEWLGDGVHDDGWRDTSVRFEGPAVAYAQQAVAENWLEAGGSLLPSDAFPPPTTSGPALAAVVTSTASTVGSRAERLMQLVFQAATRRLWIANAYFVPSAALLAILERKASEGVDVRLIVPSASKNDSKASAGMEPIEVDSLLDRGVRVLSYEPSMMHAKTVLVDDDLAVVSSINLDPLSLGNLEEVALVVQDGAFAAQLARAFEEDSQHCRTVER